jgi:NhaA family Na+:H+ antiporter
MLKKAKQAQAKITELFQYESASGILLMGMAVLAIILANSPLADIYHHVLHLPVMVQLGPLTIDKDFVHFINDGLMAVFFLLIGLEIKREILEGHLATRAQQITPIVGALGGVIVPSLIYAYFNWGVNIDNVDTIRGWAIPAATDIAFALGILSLFGSRIPTYLKVFLTALAIIDDLAAILIIAIFYNSDLSYISLLLAFGAIITLIALNLLGVTKKNVYVLVGIFLWVCVLKSGVHATLAGVVLGLTIPLRTKDEHGRSLLREMEHGMQPWVSYLILPVFAFANAGVSFEHANLSDLVHQPVTVGVAAGLFIGKQLGVFAFLRIIVALGWAKLPSDVNWKQVYGISVLTGIGFTMSIFISNLAFTNDYFLNNSARLGILAGTLFSTILGVAVLHFSCPKKK